MNDLQRFQAAYVSLLQLPQGVTRFRLQHSLIILRDRIAVLSGMTEEEVQNLHEDLARKTSVSIDPKEAKR